jgi:hypothetical protein
MNSFDDTNIELENARAIFGVDGSKIDSVPMTTEIYSEQQTDEIISLLSSKIDDVISTATLPKNIVLPNYFGENNNYNLDSWIDAVDDAVGSMINDTSKLTELSNKISTKLEGTNSSITELSGKHSQDITSVNNSISELSGKHSQDITSVNNSITSLSTKHNQDITSVNNSITSLSTKHNQDITSVNNSITSLSTKHNQDITSVNNSISELSTKHSTDITSHSNKINEISASYVTLSTDQTISSKKIFTKDIELDNSKIDFHRKNNTGDFVGIRVFDETESFGPKVGLENNHSIVDLYGDNSRISFEETGNIEFKKAGSINFAHRNSSINFSDSGPGKIYFYSSDAAKSGNLNEYLNENISHILSCSSSEIPVSRSYNIYKYTATGSETISLGGILGSGWTDETTALNIELWITVPSIDTTISLPGYPTWEWLEEPDLTTTAPNQILYISLRITSNKIFANLYHTGV